MMYSQAHKIAQRAVEHYIKHGDLLPIDFPLSASMLSQKACYVTVYEKPGYHVRGVFGRPTPAQPTLAHEIVFNTIEVVRRQEKSHIRPVDVPHLKYAISVLGPLERILDASHLNPDRFGLYVLSDRGHSAVILPQRTGIETGEEQISTAFREAGINSPDESVTMYRFLVTYYD